MIDDLHDEKFGNLMVRFSNMGKKVYKIDRKQGSERAKITLPLPLKYK